MIISHFNRFIWLKTRKSASTSIELGLNKICRSGDYIHILQEHEKKQRKVLEEKINQFNELREHKIKPHSSIVAAKKFLPKNQFNSYFKFTIERNPWDKVVSLYFYWKKQKKIKKENTFEDFINNYKFSKCRNWGLYTNHKNNILVDYIMKYENLKREMEYISDILGKKIDLYEQNIVQRPQSKQDYQQMYTKHTKEKVHEKFRKEIDYFGYTF